MKALTACLYCNKNKDCADSVTAHSFIDSCFEATEESVRSAIKDLQMLSKITLPVEVFQKTNDVAELLVDQAAKMKKLAQMIINDACASVCMHGGPCIYENEQEPKECFDCEAPCVCYDCFDGEKFKIDWSKLNET